jgi:egghead protein (zeste-white 4 protein)
MVEVVIDDPRGLSRMPQGGPIQYIVVPPEYRTLNGSLYKSRALQYALDNSLISDDSWIVHLDEETTPTPSGIAGIAKMITEEEATGRLRVGQGAILYHRSWKEHPFLTLADMVRTGDDLARFHFQHRIGITLFGLHGSYIVVRNDVEKRVGFDFGPDGSITEDAFWALELMSNGQRIRWVEGYLEEQSTQSIKDFIHQRERWYQGLVKVSLKSPSALRWRLPLMINTLLWTFSPLAVIYTAIHMFYGFSVNPTIRLLANFSYGGYMTLYLIGLKINMDESGIRGFHRVKWIVLQVVLMPIFSVIECLGVASGIARPVTGFHVVNK